MRHRVVFSNKTRASAENMFWVEVIFVKPISSNSRLILLLAVFFPQFILVNNRFHFVLSFISLRFSLDLSAV